MEVLVGQGVPGSGQAGSFGCPRVAEGAPPQVQLCKCSGHWPKAGQPELTVQAAKGLGWQVESVTTNPGLRAKWGEAAKIGSSGHLQSGVWPRPEETAQPGAPSEKVPGMLCWEEAGQGGTGRGCPLRAHRGPGTVFLRLLESPTAPEGVS